jgi:YD repeat-containing protein
MPARKISVNGDTWEVSPSGFVTQYDRDEFGLIFSRATAEGKEHRVTRYSPVGARLRDQSFLELSDDQIKTLFEQSQPGIRSPEIGYAGRSQ